MSRQRLLAGLLLAGSAVAVAAAWPALRTEATQAQAQAAAPPTRLSDTEFWRLATEFSEEDGTFHSENLVSNEIRFQTILPGLVQQVVPGRPYVGVGSEQNFTYMAAVRPSMAFIVDIRRGNLDLHLLYKALFEMSPERADFIAKVFSRPRPAGLSKGSSADQLFAAFANVAPSEAAFRTNLAAVYTHLTKTHGFGLSEGDRGGIEYVYRAWFTAGPDLHYSLSRNGGRGGGFPTYADLMTATDGAGQARSFLATEANYAYLKDLQTRNLVVPAVGNFGGPKALRAVGAYLRQRQQVIGAFYASNVEQYLEQSGIWDAFCASVATMPLDSRTTLIRSQRGGFAGVRGGGVGGGGFQLMLVPLAKEVAGCRAR